MRKNKIIASLHYGKIFSKATMGATYFSIIGFAFIIGLCIYVLITQQELVLIGCIIICCIGIGFFLWVIISQNRHIKLINIWLKDAVEVDGVMEEIPPFRTQNNTRNVAFQVTIVYNEQTITLLSDSSEQNIYDNHGIINFGRYLRFYKDTRKFLYSPTYREIVFFK